MTTPVVPTYTLNDGDTIPVIGFGTWPLNDDEAEQAVRSAIDLGYRLVDSATNYGNETGVGRAIAKAGIPREDLFVTTKLPGRDQGYDPAIRSFEEARQRLGLEYVDLYLIHWPNPRRDRYVDSWKAMIELRERGLIRSIGVSNFTAAHLQRLKDETGVVPAINQIELHPLFPQAEQRTANEAFGILTEAWSPLGRGHDILNDPRLQTIADAHSVTAGQVVLRWAIQLGTLPIPKSADPDRQRANLDLFSFALTEDEIATIASLSRGEFGRLGGNPDTTEER